MERAGNIGVNWPDKEQYVLEGESLETLGQDLMPIMQTYDREVTDIQGPDAHIKQLGAQVCALKEASTVIMAQLDRPVTFRALNDLVAELTDNLSEKHKLAKVHGANACGIAILGLIEEEVFREVGPERRLMPTGPLPEA